MHHTVDDYQSNYNANDALASFSKKVKRSYININQLTLHDHTLYQSILLNTRQPTCAVVMDVDKHVQNDLTKRTILPQLTAQPPSSSSATTTVSVIPNRKRRYRNTHDVYTMDSSTACSTTNIDGQIRKKSDLSCVVCCAVAHGYNFDAISCESCKAFFRRNALTNIDRLKCRRDQNCEITLETRRRCKSCRLKKCFAVGMRKEWILTEEEKVNKKRRIEENKRLHEPDVDSPPSSKHTSKKKDSDLQNVLFNKHEKPVLKLRSSVQKSDIITNVVLAYNDSIQLDLTGYAWSYPLARKITALCQIINTRNTTALRLISFFKRLHDFNLLNETDKINLIKHNLHFVFFFHASLKYDPVHDIYHEENTNDKPLHGAYVREAYGNDNYIRLTKIMRALNSIVQIDKCVMQVALVIFLFSNGLSIATNSNELSNDSQQQIFRIQTIYTEQLWLFLERNYGRLRAAFVFSTLVSKCILIQEVLRDIQHDVYEKLDPCQVPPILWSIMQSS